MKLATCTQCSTRFEWTTLRSDLCKPCRRIRKQRIDRGEIQATPRIADRDPLPPVDWVMELQFARFFRAMGKRYKNVKDVMAVAQHETYRKKA